MVWKAQEEFLVQEQLRETLQEMVHKSPGGKPAARPMIAYARSAKRKADRSGYSQEQAIREFQPTPERMLHVCPGVLLPASQTNQRLPEVKGPGA
jgi:hypothetical protein